MRDVRFLRNLLRCRGENADSDSEAYCYSQAGTFSESQPYGFVSGPSGLQTERGQ